MNVTDEQKEKLKCKIEGRERNLRRERVIKAVRVRAFFIWGLAGAIFLKEVIPSTHIRKDSLLSILIPW